MEAGPYLLSAYRKRHARQRGVYAIEFGLVFLIFFLVLYAILAYGVIFAIQQTLNGAAQSGARTALTWQGSEADRQAAVEAEVKRLSGWLGNCSGHMSCNFCSPLVTASPCPSSTTPDLYTVVLSYDYTGDGAFVPPLPGAEFFLPSTLRASATVNLDITALSRGS